MKYKNNKIVLQTLIIFHLIAFYLLIPSIGYSQDNQIEQLIQNLRQHNDQETRNKAQAALKQIGEPAIEPLIAVLKDKDKYLRYYAASTLGVIGDSRAVEPLCNLLMHEENRGVRFVAMTALGSIVIIYKDTRAVSPLVTLLKDNDLNIRFFAAKYLGYLGALGVPASIKPLIDAMKDVDWNVRYAATYSLIEIGRPAAQSLTALLTTGRDWDVQLRAALALGKIKDADAIEYLIIVLRNDNLAVEAVEKVLKA